METHKKWTGGPKDVPGSRRHACEAGARRRPRRLEEGAGRFAYGGSRAGPARRDGSGALCGARVRMGTGSGSWPFAESLDRVPNGNDIVWIS